MLYSFLTSDDLDSAIKEEMLYQLVRDNLGLVGSAEASAVSWMKDYLGQRFDVAAVFPNIGEWTAGSEYGPAQSITIPGEPATVPAGIAFYERPNEIGPGQSYTPQYERNAAGRLTNYAWHAGQCYEALRASLNVEPGTPAAQTYWRPRDPRDPKVMMFCVDITLFRLFQRVSPRKIPDLRTSLYNQAKEWLTMVADGSLTPDLPRPIKVADSSDTIRWGSNAARQHYY
ncbi:Protein of unknown function [Hymenobacter daecheongensis DSM 21074]|uniref:DUF1320 domain-containing protein n=1 Tax=Hymenobacter daecheongensis DSM 21074 TaxID=1121955 RepID=A0A1M6LX41_9BACT|nr:phage protein Gp36 family protein [Hymenobacter daecheongensis]SHJ75712.1 Protein of unknown function [Hymenobacter daecheongensis DSM 21074]